MEVLQGWKLVDGFFVFQTARHETLEPVLIMLLIFGFIFSSSSLWQKPELFFSLSPGKKPGQQCRSTTPQLKKKLQLCDFQSHICHRKKTISSLDFCHLVACHVKNYLILFISNLLTKSLQFLVFSFNFSLMKNNNGSFLFISHVNCNSEIFDLLDILLITHFFSILKSPNFLRLLICILFHNY